MQVVTTKGSSRGKGHKDQARPSQDRRGVRRDAGRNRVGRSQDNAAASGVRGSRRDSGAVATGRGKPQQSTKGAKATAGRANQRGNSQGSGSSRGMEEPNLLTYSPGDDIMFMPGEIREDKPWRRGVFERVHSEDKGIVLVRLSGDPFSVCVYAKQIRPATEKEKKMPTATAKKPQAKEMRRRAKAL